MFLFCNFYKQIFKAILNSSTYNKATKQLYHSSLQLEIVEDSVLGRWEGGDKEQSSVVSAIDNERSVWLAMILLVWIRRPRLIPGSWPLSCCSAFLFSARSLHLSGQPGPSCEMAFSRLRLGIDGLLTNWLKSDDVDLVSQPGFFRKSKQ